MSIKDCIKIKKSLPVEDSELFATNFKDLVDGGVPTEDAYSQAAELVMESILVERNALAEEIRDFGGYLADISIEELLAPVKTQPAVKTEESLSNDKNLSAYGQAGYDLAVKISEKIKAGEKITWQQLFSLADKSFNGTQAAGTYGPKDAYDAMELGLNLAILDSHNFPDDMYGGNIIKARVSISNMAEMVDLLPTQTKRTDEQDQMQQYSTPPFYAYMASWVANLKETDSLVEPSAGTGNLSIHALKAGVKNENIFVNELSDKRADLLESIFDNVTRENANNLNSVLPAHIKPTVVVMNPPFSADINKIGKKDLLLGAKHVEQALQRLEEGGRLVAILGKGMEPGKMRTRKWWDKIQDKYNVRANIQVSGEEYKKFGTTFDNQFIVIDKTGKTPEGAILTGRVEKVFDLIKLLEGIRNDRIFTAKQESIEPGSETQTGTDENQGERPVSIPTPTGTGSNADQGGRPTTGGPRGSSSNVGGTNGGTTKGGNGLFDDVRTGGENANTGTENQGGTTGNTGTGNNSNAKPENKIGLEVENADLTPVKIGSSSFENYRSPIKIKGSKQHPTKLAESAAMSAVKAPKTNYTPSLPQELIDSGKLSDVQLESVVRSGDAHKTILPDGSRKGFFIGDGTGVGKGAQIAGIILDNYNKGRKKAVWVSENQKLFKDAKRDVKWVGGKVSGLFKQGTVKGPIKQQEGTIFTTYTTLASQAKATKDSNGEVIPGDTRMDQLVSWLGEDFDGVIAFDESHNMANAIDMRGNRGIKKASKRALSGVDLQRRLPKARIVYVSATGATEVANLAYADRLGLWGEGTPFPNKLDFINKITAGGVAAMEVVAKDMKGMGVYTSRALSFDDVGYSTIEHVLNKNQREIYDALAGAWQVVLDNVNQALEDTGAVSEGQTNGGAKSAAYSAFWGSHQRFFNQILTGLSIPSVIKDVEKQLEAGNSVVMQLVNTNEAVQERRMAQAAADNIELDDIDITPRDMLMQYVNNGFPVNQYEEYTDEDGNIRSRPVEDSQGNHVLNPQAVEKREQMLDLIGSLNVLEGPLEQLINHFGGEKVAEITGRKRRLVRDKNGKVTEEKLSAAKSDADAQAFMDGKKRILIFSDAGGTGRSYHSSLKEKNQQKRIHYLVQPGWRADKAVQGTGRTHRTNQKSAPHYKLVTTDIKAQRRFISTIARRLDQLGALTKGQRDTTSQGMFTADMNLESQYGEAALDILIRDVQANRVPGITMADFEQQTGINVIDDETGSISENKMPTVPKFLNRLLSMKIDVMDTMFSEFFLRLEAAIQYAKEQGTFDSGMETVQADKITKISEEKIPDRNTHYVKVELENPAIHVQFDDLPQEAVFARHATSGKLYAFTKAQTITDVSTGRIVKRRRRISPNGGDYITKELFEAKYEGLLFDSNEKIRSEWNDDLSKLSPVKKSTKHLITGELLSIWDRLPTAQPKIIRMITDEKEILLGREIKNREISGVLKALGVSVYVPKLTNEQWIKEIKNKGASITLSNGWVITQKRVSGENRLEITGPSYSEGNLIIQQGGFRERIAYQSRLFLPINNTDVFNRVMNNKIITEVNYKDESINENNGLYSGYEVQEPTGKTDNANTGREPEQWDLFAAADIPDEAVKPQAIDNYAVEFRQAETSQIKSGFDVLNTPEEAAHLIAPIRKHAQETFMVIVTDKNKKVLNVIRHTKGSLNASSVYPTAVLGAIASTEGAANYWLAHNHPAGITDPSESDYKITKVIIDKSDGMDIKYEGHLVVGEGQTFNYFADPDDYSYEKQITPARRLKTISITERVIKKRANKDGITLDSPLITKNYVKGLEAESGIILMDNKHKVVGVLALTPEEMSLLRDGKQVKRILAGISKSNAAAVITFINSEKTKGKEARDSLKNLGNFLARHDEIRHLDGLYLDNNGILTAVAETGEMIGSENSPFYSRRKATGTKTAQVKNWISKPLSKLGNWVDVQIVQSVSDLPGQHPDDVRGMKLTDKVYLVADNISDQKDAMTVLTHEVVGHLGLEKTMGKAGFDGLVKQIQQYKRDGKQEIIDIIEELKKSYVDENGKYNLTEKQESSEVMAKLAEVNPNFGLVRTAINRIKLWLSRHGFGKWVDFDKAHLESLLIRASQTANTNYSGFIEKSGKPVPSYMVAWHGGPHDHNAFSTDYIGTGEGAQAYGWGLYFTESKQVAQFYKETLKQKLYLDKSFDILRNDLSEKLSDFLVKIMIQYNGPLKGSQKQVLSRNYYHGDYLKNNWEKVVSLTEKAFKEAKNNKGGLYQVELAPAEDEYLLWDKPLSEQSTKVKKSIKPAVNKILQKKPYLNTLEKSDGRSIYEILTQVIPSSKTIVEAGMTGRDVDKKEASEYLKSLGIRGIKYLDGVSRTNKKGTYNYVIFDDADVSIIDKSYSRSEKAEYQSAIAKGLPMDEESRLQRARDMGFDTDTVWYRGSDADEKTARRFTHLTQYLDTAHGFAGADLELRAFLGEKEPQEGANIAQYFIKVKNTATESDMKKLENQGIGFENQNYSELEKLGFDSYEDGEGIAVFSPENIRSINAAFDPDYKDSANILYSRKQKAANLGLEDETMKDFLIRQAQDGFNRVKKLQETIKDLGGIVTEASNIYLAEERSSGIISARLDDLKNNLVTPLVDQMKKKEITLEQLDQFVMATHAFERNEYIAEINPRMEEAGSGLDDIEAAEILENFDKEGLTEKLQSLADIVYDMNEQALGTLYDGGLIDEETFSEYRSQYDYYVPLKGKEGQENRAATGQGYSVMGAGLKAAMGRGEGNIAESPVAHSIAQAETAIIRAEKSKIGRALVELMKDNPDPKFWTLTKRNYKKFIGLEGEVFEGFEELPETMIENQDVMRVKAITPRERKLAKLEGRKPVAKVVYKLDPSYKFRDDVFSVMIDGKLHQITIKDQILAEQLKKLNTNELNRLVQGMGKVNRYLAMINTAINPEFVITNFERDIQTAGINVAGEQSAKMALQVVKDSPAASKGIFQYFFSKEKAKNNEWSKLFDELRHQGGTIGFFGLEDIQTKVDKIEKKLKYNDSYLGKTMDGIRKARDVILDANQAVENAARLSAYKAGIDAGMSKKEAASLSKNLTVNFNRRGEMAPIINSAYLFANASIQGSFRVFSALKHPNVRKIVGGIASTAFALAAYNMAAGGDDDDDVSHWEKISDYTKQTNLIIMHPDGSGDYFKFKLPYGYNVFWYAGYAFHDLMFGKNTTALKTSANMMTAFLNAFNPLQGADLLDTITPTVLKPMEQSARNINFMNTPIKPENPYDRYERPESDKAYNSTNQWMKDLAKILNSSTGGDDTTSGFIDVSPETMKHYLGWITGGAGMTVYRAIGTGTNLVTGQDIPAKDIPFIRTLGGTTGTHYDTQRFYETVNKIEAAVEQASIYRENRDYRAGEFRSDNMKVLGLIKSIPIMKKRIKALRDKRNKAYRDNDYDLANKYKEKIAKEMRRLIKRYDQAKKG